MNNKLTVLARHLIDGHGSITITLLRPEDMSAATRTFTPSLVRIVWPQEPTIVTAKEFPEVAAALTKLFAEAATELASIKARRRL